MKSEVQTVEFCHLWNEGERNFLSFLGVFFHRRITQCLKNPPNWVIWTIALSVSTQRG